MNCPIFIHVPRTGGNSLIPHLSGKNVHIVHHVEKLDLTQFNGNWVFSFMRDPIDRAISAYAYLRCGGGSEQDNIDADKYVRPYSSLEEFVLNGLKLASEQQRHFMPQSYWLTDSIGKIVPNFIGRTEKLQRYFDHVCDVCEWPKVQLEILNGSNREGLSCTPTMQNVIREIYEGDYSILPKLES